MFAKTIRSVRPRHPAGNGRWLLAATAASVGLATLGGARSNAATFTYTNATGTAEWSTGANWSSSPNPPTSASTTTLAFSGALASTNVEDSDNDLTGNFLLNQMTVAASGPTTGTAPTLTISGNPLEFVNDTTDPNNPIAPGLAFNITMGNRTPAVNVSNNLVLTNSLTLSNSTSAIPTVSGVISSTGGLTMTGTGTIALTNTASTYTGVTTLNSGVLRVAAMADFDTASSIGTGSVAGSAADIVFGGAALQYTGTTATSTDRLFTIGNGTGNTATLDASGTSAGTFNWTSIGAIAFGTTGVAHTMIFTGSFATASTFAPLITDQDPTTAKTSVTKTGTGAWAMTNANTYSGGTTISGGVLEAVADEGFGTGLVTVTAGQAYGAGSTYSNDWSIAGTGGGTGALRFLGTAAGVTVSGNINLTADAQISNEAAAANKPNTTVTLSGQISGNYAVTFLSGTSGTNVTIALANSGNNWTGDTTVAAGGTSGGTHELLVDADEVIPNGAGYGNVVFTSTGGEGGHAAVLALNGHQETINGLVGMALTGVSPNQVVENGATGTSTATLTVGDGDASGNFIGQVEDGSTGKLNLVKIGSGTETLADVNTYTGTTTISGGTLQVDFNQYSHTQSSSASNYFSSKTDVTLDGATLAIQGRQSGAVISATNIAFAQYNAYVDLPDAVAAQLAAGQALTLTVTSGTGTPATGMFVVDKQDLGTGYTRIFLPNRAGGGTNDTGTVSSTVTTAATTQTLQSFTLGGASGSNSTLDFGSSGSVVLTIDAAPVQTNDGSTLTIANWDGTAGQGGGTNQLIFVGDPTDFSNVFSQSEIFFTGYAPGYQLIDGSGSYEVVAPVSAVPEPASLALLGFGAAGLLIRKRRHQKG